MKEPGVIRLSRFLSHSPARVWRALTEPELVAQWWAPGDVRPIVGHRFALDMGQWGKQHCQVTAVEIERLLQYRFALDTTITWRLTPEREGTLLSLEHSGFDLDSPLARKAFEGMGNGWPGVLDRLDVTLSGTAGS